VPYLLVPCCVGKINSDLSLGAVGYTYPSPMPRAPAAGAGVAGEHGEGGAMGGSTEVLMPSSRPAEQGQRGPMPRSQWLRRQVRGTARSTDKNEKRPRSTDKNADATLSVAAAVGPEHGGVVGACLRREPQRLRLQRGGRRCRAPAWQDYP
jgi:hypothetical protein